jgi:hypothetical protein
MKIVTKNDDRKKIELTKEGEKARRKERENEREKKMRKSKNKE